MKSKKQLKGSIKKIEQLSEIRSEMNLEFQIEIDGGINPENIKRVSDAGCDMFVIGSSIFNQDNISAATTELKNLISK